MPRKLILLLYLCALVLAGETPAEVDASNLGIDSISFDVRGGLFYQPRPHDDGHILFHRPEYLSVRRPYDSGVRHRWDLTNDFISDSPMPHGPSFVEFMARIKRGKSLTVLASLVADHRGFSMGTYNQDHVTVYPKFLIDYHAVDGASKIRPFGLGSELRLKAGTFQAERYYEGLQIYNMDFQAVYIHAQLGRIRLSHLHIGDMKVGIGLNIDDLLDYMISIETLHLSNDIMADIRFGLTDYADYGTANWLSNGGKSVDAVNFSAGVQFSPALRCYGQLGYRKIDGEYGEGVKTAGLIGGHFKNVSQRLHVDSRVEYRYYGSAYNYHLMRDLNTYYRDRGWLDNGNYIGDQLYPMELVDRPFSQWAVFTEYEERTVRGLTLYAKTRWYVAASQFIYAEVDFNTIFAEKEKTFTYPFYKAGIAFQSGPNNFVLFSVSNKTMNLDKHFPTFYCMKTQLIQVEVRRMVDWID